MKIEIDSIEISEENIEAVYTVRAALTELRPYGRSDLSEYVRNRIVESLTDKYIESFGADVLASIDPKVVANLIAVNSARNIRGSN